MDLASALLWLNLAGVAVFAASGALAAAQKKHDIITFAFFASVTGMGGGTLRDVLMDVPVFWVKEPSYVLMCTVSAVGVWLLRPGPRAFHALLWMDALGLSAYAVLGAAKALAAGLAPTVAVVMGVLTAGFGGILRDVLASEPSILLRREIYVTAALLAAGIYAMGVETGHALWGAAAGCVLGFGLRAGALLYGWTLPGFRADNGA
jgi:uncharacterized membrane protein YeiH